METRSEYGGLTQIDTLEQLVERVRPVTLADQQVLPVLPALGPLLPGAGLQRGSVVETRGRGATSLALALAVGPSEAGSWTVSVGLSRLGLAAAAELGIDLGLLALVREPEPAQWGSVVAALIGAFDVVLVRVPRRVRRVDARRLIARARERGTVIVHVADSESFWPEGPDLVLAVASMAWEGLGVGHGHLRARRVEVAATGRRRASRPKNASLWLPGPDGRIATVDSGPVALPAHTTSREHAELHGGVEVGPMVSDPAELTELVG